MSLITDLGKSRYCKGISEQVKQSSLMLFLVSFWGNKARISPKVMGVFR